MKDDEIIAWMDTLSMEDLNIPIKPPRKIGKTQCCSDPNIIFEGGCEVCDMCGWCGSKQHLVLSYKEGFRISNSNQLYKRISYFKHKIEQLNGSIYPHDENTLPDILEKLRKHPVICVFMEMLEGKPESEKLRILIETRFMYGLRCVLRTLSKKNLYKFSFLLTNALFNVRCFNLPHSTVLRLAQEWREFEYHFKRHNKGRKNSYSYNVFLQEILRNNGIPNYELITLPINYGKVLRELRVLMNKR